MRILESTSTNQNLVITSQPQSTNKSSSYKTKIAVAVGSLVLHDRALVWINKTWDLTSDQSIPFFLAACVTFVATCYFGPSLVTKLISKSANPKPVDEDVQQKVEEPKVSMHKRSHSRISKRELKSLGIQD